MKKILWYIQYIVFVLFILITVENLVSSVVIMSKSRQCKGTIAQLNKLGGTIEAVCVDYNVNGVEYKSGRNGREPRYSFSETEKWMTEGEEIKVWVNKNNPEDIHYINFKTLIVWVIITFIYCIFIGFYIKNKRIDRVNVQGLKIDVKSYLKLYLRTHLKRWYFYLAIPVLIIPASFAAFMMVLLMVELGVKDIMMIITAMFIGISVLSSPLVFVNYQVASNANEHGISRGDVNLLAFLTHTTSVVLCTIICFIIILMRNGR